MKKIRLRNNGIKTHTMGYIYERKPDHPFADNQGYVRRSRLVIEKNLGRYLRPEEVTHHKNRIKDDDRLENITLFPNNKEHMKCHGKDGYHTNETSYKSGHIPWTKGRKLKSTTKTVIDGKIVEKRKYI